MKRLKVKEILNHRTMFWATLEVGMEVWPVWWPHSRNSKQSRPPAWLVIGGLKPRTQTEYEFPVN